MRIFHITLIFCLLSVYLLAENADSLKQALKKETHPDSIALKMIDLGKAYKTRDLDSSIFYLRSALAISEKNGFKKGIGSGNLNIAVIFRSRQQTDSALIYYNNSLMAWNEVADTAEITKVYTHLGNMNGDLGKFDECIRYHEIALNLATQANLRKQIGQSQFNLGNAYKRINILSKALNCYMEAKQIFEELNDEKGRAASLNLIGILYMDWLDYEKALSTYYESLKMEEARGNKQGMLDIHINIGTALIKLDKKQDAIVSYKTALDISYELADKNKEAYALFHIALTFTDLYDFPQANVYIGKLLTVIPSITQKDVLARTLQALGYCYLIQNRCQEALASLTKSREIAESSGLNDIASTCYLFLSQAYICVGDGIKSAEYYKKYDQAKEASNKLLNDARVQFETAQQEKEIKLLNEQQETSRKLIKAQRQAIYIFIAGLILIGAFLIIVVRQYRQKKKANVLLAKQKHEIEIQKKEIEDSITYAKRIQEAVISLNDTKDTLLEKSFVMFRPKSVVSGDFFWATDVGDWTIVTVADCTGHGVPGAFMSMLGVSFLTEIVRKKDINNAADILNELRKYIIDALKQRGLMGEQKDGMDISLCVINKKTLVCQWAGASNPLYIIKAGDDNKKELIEIKADKMPVAIYERMSPFTNHIIQLERGNRLYLFSDGYADQFGGSAARKFMSKKLKALLIESASLSISQQYETLCREFDHWLSYTDPESGHPFEQIDDVTVMGIEI